MFYWKETGWLIECVVANVLFFRSVVFSVDFDGVICLDGVRLDGLRQS